MPTTPVVEPLPAMPVTPVVETVPSTQPVQPSPSAQKKKREGSAARHKKPSVRRLMFTALRDVLIALALLAILLQFFSPTVVREHSMEDTLKENDVLYIAKQAYLFGEPQHGDIVVFHTVLETSGGSEKALVKRIIGVPGDRISISGGVVFRNGAMLDEPYLKTGHTSGELSEVVVPPDSYFVLGDNREVSNDSRNSAIGFVSKQQLQGKALLRIFPLADFRVF
jgi:signal peptidase I